MSSHEAPSVFLNGRVMAASDARLEVDDVGFLHGANVFTTLAARHGKPFRLDRHLARLARTAGQLGLKVRVDATELTAATTDLLAANALDRARLRITLSAGSIRTGEAMTLVTAVPLPQYPPAWFTEGITVAVSHYRQWPADPTYGHKTGNYLTRILARRAAAEQGAEEALWFTPKTGGITRLAEGCFTNVFLMAGGRLRTPALDTPVLPGVTREAVIEVAAGLGIDCDAEAVLTIDDVLAAEEIFLTASTMGVVPVSHVRDHAVGTGRPGELTLRLRSAYESLVDSDTAPDN